MYLTLNVTDSPWHTHSPHCGSIGHVIPFPEAVQLAHKYGFSGINIDIDFLRAQGPEVVKSLLNQYNLIPAAFPCTLLFHSTISGIKRFREDCNLCSLVGCKRCVMYIPSASDSIPFHKHFNLMSCRLQYAKPILEEFCVKLGLEFIGAQNARIDHQYDFIHTIDGVRSLIAASGLSEVAGIKFDIHHWFTSGAQLLDLQMLGGNEIVYLELNDGLLGAGLSQPEFDRRLPMETGCFPIMQVLQILHGIGYNGPVVAEPWYLDICQMNYEDAIHLVKESLVRSFTAAGIPFK